MFTRGLSAANYKLKNYIESLLHPYKSKSGNISPGFQHQEAIAKRHGFHMNQCRLSSIITNIGMWRRLDANLSATKDEKEKDRHSPAGQAAGSGQPPKFNFSLWARCVLASVLSFLLPFWKEKWGKLKRIEGSTDNSKVWFPMLSGFHDKEHIENVTAVVYLQFRNVYSGEAEMVVEEVEAVAEVAEKVATAAEKISAQVAEKLPDDSKLKKAALVVEHVSDITAHDAHATTEFIHQVEAIKHDVDGLESLVEPIVYKIVKHGSQ
ncbi:hypothetical protein PTKIN_Ptkin02bG0154700 [Pterospermum kingtungense]